MSILLARIKILGLWRGLITTLLGYSYSIKRFNLDLSRRLLYFKHNIILNFISKLDITSNELEYKKSIEQHTIWVLWWQGYDDAPPLVKACINSIYRNKGEFNVILLSSDNIDKYIEIPYEIKSKVGKGMKYAHLADYIRLKLLATYGGLWIDSTFLLTSPLPSEIADYSWYTIRSRNEYYYCISNFRWAINFMYFSKDNLFVKKLFSLFDSYWMKYDVAIDYFIMDYAIYWLLYNNKLFLEDFAIIPKSNPECFDGLMNMLNDSYEENKYNKMISKTWAHKLSYRIELKNDPISYYSHLLNEFQS